MHAVLGVQKLVHSAALDAPLHQAPAVELTGLVLTDLGERLKLMVVLMTAKLGA